MLMVLVQLRQTLQARLRTQSALALGLQSFQIHQMYSLYR